MTLDFTNKMQDLGENFEKIKFESYQQLGTKEHFM